MNFKSYREKYSTNPLIPSTKYDQYGGVTELAHFQECKTCSYPRAVNFHVLPLPPLNSPLYALSFSIGHSLEASLIAW